jgi:hypothetical protein
MQHHSTICLLNLTYNLIMSSLQNHGESVYQVALLLTNILNELAHLTIWTQPFII